MGLNLQYSIGQNLEINLRAPEFNISIVSENHEGLVLRMPRGELPEKLLPGSHCIVERDKGKKYPVEVKACRPEDGWLEISCSYINTI